MINKLIAILILPNMNNPIGMQENQISLVDKLPNELKIHILSFYATELPEIKNCNFDDENAFEKILCSTRTAQLINSNFNELVNSQFFIKS